MNKNKRAKSITIQSEIFLTMIVLVSFMAVLIAGISIWMNVSTERERLDENLENIATGVSKSEIVIKELSDDETDIAILIDYLDSTKNSMSNLDVISIVDTNVYRRYHTNHDLIDTIYDGTMPDFSAHDNKGYVENNVGPSGSQRRAYAPIINNEGEYIGFVMAVMLNSNIKKIVSYTIYMHVLVVGVVILLAAALSLILANSVKNRLNGYEPDTFTNMFNIRENVLESLEEGILAVDEFGKLLYMNNAAKTMLKLENLANKDKTIEKLALLEVIKSGEKDIGAAVHFVKGAEILADKIPVTSEGRITGALVILRDRTELTQIAEDLSGVRFLVDSMRANNHEFTNKLHVILGLIQMEKYNEASDYISNLTSINISTVKGITKKIEDPSVAALLIGKSSRCAELNVSLNFEKETHLYREDISLPSGDLVTIIGNLIENALDSLNESRNLPKELNVLIMTEPHAMIIRIDDTGTGIASENLDRIFEKGFSTKGDGRGSGLYIIRKIIEKYNGTITVDSELNQGTSFMVTLTDEEM